MYKLIIIHMLLLSFCMPLGNCVDCSSDYQYVPGLSCLPFPFEISNKQKVQK